jgi:hypothetical protein
MKVTNLIILTSFIKFRLASKFFQLTATYNLITKYRIRSSMNKKMYLRLFDQDLCSNTFFVQLTVTNNLLLKVNQTLLTLKTI